LPLLRVAPTHHRTVATEMALCVLTYNLTRALNIVGV